MFYLTLRRRTSLSVFRRSKKDFFCRDFIVCAVATFWVISLVGDTVPTKDEEVFKCQRAFRFASIFVFSCFLRVVSVSLSVHFIFFSSAAAKSMIFVNLTCSQMSVVFRVDMSLSTENSSTMDFNVVSIFFGVYL